MGKVVAFANQKGGVGKTTSTINVAAALAMRGKRVLMVDMDPQASLTIYAGLEPYDYDHTIVDLLQKRKADPHNCIVAVRENMDIIPSRIELAALEAELLGRMARELMLATALAPVKGEYDYIVIDCPPQLSTLTINSFACSDGVIIPCKTDYLAYRGIHQLLETISTVQELFKPDIRPLGILATMYDARVKDDQEVLSLLRDEYTVIGVIKRTAQAKKGIYDGLSSVEFLPNSDLAKEYVGIADLILNQY